MSFSHGRPVCCSQSLLPGGTATLRQSPTAIGTRLERGNASLALRASL